VAVSAIAVTRLACADARAASTGEALDMVEQHLAVERQFALLQRQLMLRVPDTSRSP
jgi:hypothetical protein